MTAIEVIFVALIKCPDCGRDVSDRAESCPNCGCPVESSSGTVRIMLPVLVRQSIFAPNQKVTISFYDEILWEGVAGDVAEVYLEDAAFLTIKYHENLLLSLWGVEGTGIVDPSKSRRYTVSLHTEFMSGELVLQPF